LHKSSPVIQTGANWNEKWISSAIKNRFSVTSSTNSCYIVHETQISCYIVHERHEFSAVKLHVGDGIRQEFRVEAIVTSAHFLI